jgi:hypothetical protein
VSNGWYRFQITATSTANNTVNMIVRTATAINVDSYTGDGTSGIFVFGAQLEAGAFPTSYIPTTTTSLTRSADVASVTTLSPWYNASEGTLYAEFVVPFDSSLSIFPIAAYVSDGTFNNTVTLYERTIDDTRRGNIRVGGVQQFDQPNGGTYTYGTVAKTALAFKINDVAFSANGTAPTTSTSALIPSVNVLGLGSTFSLGGALSALNGHLRRITYYNTRLPNAQLQALTAP